MHERTLMEAAQLPVRSRAAYSYFVLYYALHAPFMVAAWLVGGTVMEAAWLLVRMLSDYLCLFMYFGLRPP